MLSIKNKKILINVFLLAALVVFLIFALSTAIFKYKKIYNPEKKSGVTGQSWPLKTEQEIIDSLTVSAFDKGQSQSISGEVMDSLTVPVSVNNDSAGDSQNNKATPSPIPVSEDIINSLTAPAKK